MDRPTILIVDDNEFAREVLRGVMSDLHAHLRCAASGAEALAMAEECIPDLILLDVMMPSMDGFEVCRRVRANPRLADVPVVMATALEDVDSKLKALEAGADDFVSKPINRVELHARAQTILRLNQTRKLVKRQGELESSLGALATNFDAVLKAIVTSLDARTQAAEGHTHRTTKLMIAIARRLEMREDELVHLRRGALLHNIGTIRVPESILRKAGELTASERATLQQHPQHAHDMLASIEDLRASLDIPYCHNERWNGSGFPRKLKGTDIPLAARIFAVAQAWDSMTSGAHPVDSASAAATLEAEAGVLFDPTLVKIALEITREPHVITRPARS